MQVSACLIWECRFLAPPSLPDPTKGLYNGLILSLPPQPGCTYLALPVSKVEHNEWNNKNTKISGIFASNMGPAWTGQNR